MMVDSLGRRRTPANTPRAPRPDEPVPSIHRTGPARAAIDRRFGHLPRPRRMDDGTWRCGSCHWRLRWYEKSGWRLRHYRP